MIRPLLALVLGLVLGGTAGAAPLPDPDLGTGGPILVVRSSSSPFAAYYPEILRTEGFNSFAVEDIGSVTALTLAPYEVLILTETALTPGQVAVLTDWVNAGGNLIAMRPDAQLEGLLGISGSGSTLSEGYLQVDTSGPPGNGITGETMQFHGSADLYSLAGAAPLATLYSDATTPTSHPAVTLRGVGANGGQAAAFAYDLATSVVYTRQGNPDWAEEERDGLSPIRSDDKFYGDAAGDPQPDWVDLDKVHIPQADEQQRLLVNLVLHMNRDRKPLPRFWYFPRGERAVVIMTGDDHANGGTAPRFDDYIAMSPPGCSVEDWECIRGTSYIYPDTPITAAQAASYAAQGFEVGLHVSTGCQDYTEAALETFYSDQIAEFFSLFPALPALTTQRHHCIAWTDWVTGAKVQLDHGMRLDTSYYFYPPNWVDNRPGFFTGSGVPMRFSDTDGTLIDVYQAATQLTDESGQQYPYSIDRLLDRALGPDEFFGAMTVNAHTDFNPIIESDAVINSAVDRGVPVVTSDQMLRWIDGRNSSSFASLAWNAGSLSFTVSADPAANGLEALVPWSSDAGVIAGITRDGTAIPYTSGAVKGVESARFSASSGDYVVSYAADSVGPTISSVTPADGASFVNPGASVRVAFSEGMDAASISAANFGLLHPSSGTVPASVSYDAITHTATLTPASVLETATTYTASIQGGASGPLDLGGNPLAADVVWSFTTVPPPQCPCSVWDEPDAPLNPSEDDPSAVELGTKFRSDLDGFITGVRFYKGPLNTGTHFAHLWAVDGTLLATAAYSGETASGWQQADFAKPVAITANTVYVVSYYAPNGNYANDGFALNGAGVDSYPLHILKDGEFGANGVYRFGASAFPNDTFESTNYWVDPVFDTGVPPDTTPPAVSATDPAAGATDVVYGSDVTVTFNEAIDSATLTAATFELRDSVGALVPASVSLDGLTNIARLSPDTPLDELTLHTATVRGGPSGVRDLAGNALVSDVVWTFTSGAAPTCPCSGWTGSDTPSNPSENDPSAVELGVKFTSDVDGFIGGIRFYKGAGNTGTHTGHLWTSGGALLASVTFAGESASGWQQADFATPVAISAGAVYVASYHAPNGHYAADAGYFANGGVDALPLHLLEDGVSGGNGVYAYGAAASFPAGSSGASNYWVDPVFLTDNGLPPAVSATDPADGAADVGAGATVSASFSEALDPNSVTPSSFELRDDVGTLVPASVAYDASTRSATLTPATDLAYSTTYSARVAGGPGGAADASGEPLAADVIWSFTTGLEPACCTVWGPGDIPSNPSENDPSAVELGVKFTSDVDGFISGIRFYKGTGNTGTHTGHLWTSGGALLGSVTFTGETASGWQQAVFAAPLAISAGSVYVASYHAPNGHYSADGSFFANGGVDAPPLHLLEDGVSGGNGVYVYGAGGSFPGSSYKATNYWVDPVFATENGLPPAVSATNPADGASGVAVDASVTATFSEPMDPTSISASSFELRDDLGALVPASVAYDASTRSATLTPPTDLANSATYSARVVGGPGGVQDQSGEVLPADVSWSFGTAAAEACCTAWSSTDVPSNPSENDPSAVELGVKFSSDIDGFISGIRFYKGTGNTGTHTGHLWTSGGALLASVTFSGESASGWQQADFATPVAVSAGSTYVASYHAPNGHYAADARYFANAGVDAPPLHLLQDGVSGGNGVYAYGPGGIFPAGSFKSTNYWVDVVFQTQNPFPPAVSATDPADGAGGVAVDAPVTATFSEAMDPGSISGSTFELRDDAGGLIPASIAYDAAMRRATLTPASDLANSATYSARVVGGPGGVQDQSGEVLPADVSWSFTTAAQPACCTVWSPSDAPSNPSENDPSAVELGVKFSSDIDGFIGGIRFYKGTGNTGIHTGSLWTSGGTLLGSVTFGAESASGWQQADFATPVAINAGTVYVASYYAPNGHYSADAGFFASAGVDALPLHLPQNGVSGGNGVYMYGPGGIFPGNTYNSSNYWVDVVFLTENGLPPAVVATDPADGAIDTSIGGSVTATFSEPMDPATLDASSFELRDGNGAAVAASVGYDGPSRTATLLPDDALSGGVTYTARILGSVVTDATGVPLPADHLWSFTTDPFCANPANGIAAENCLPGDPASEWDIVGIGDSSIQGFATDISVNRGDTVSFKISTDASDYTLDIYRMGYYGGLGARRVATVAPSVALPQNQPACNEVSATGLIDCGNWAVSASWNVPANATSGIYFAKLERSDTGGASHVVFVVRDDASTSDILFQTSDTTWQAYNDYGGNSLYTGDPAGRAYATSYNRPFRTREVDNGQDWVFNAEYPMVRWLERNGFDVSYFTGVDSDRIGALITNHAVFLSVGHDEYWSAAQRANVEAARDAGVHLGFFSGNEVYWKTRWEDGYRTLVCYKETAANSVIDPEDPPTWTGTWRDPRFSPPADGGRPENELTGQIFMVNEGATTNIRVPAEDGRMRFWRGTSVASLPSGSMATLANETLGYEWDVDADNGVRPPGSFRLSSTTVLDAPVLQDWGSTYAPGTATHNMTIYRHPSGALVFGAGTVQWAWGLDSNHDRGSDPEDARMQQATLNLLADMGVQPGTLQAGLVAASASSDFSAPGSAIDFPANGATLALGVPVDVSGTAVDSGGGVVGGVEISLDDGATWHPANGRESWSHGWVPDVSGPTTIRVRAVDDSGNLEGSGAVVAVTVQ